MNKSTDWQAFSVELAMEAKKNLDAKDDEITTLRQQLAKSEAHILRKQAEAVEAQAEDEKALFGFNTAAASRMRYSAQRLRNQANELEDRK